MMDHPSASGLEYFDTLRAEDETAWLPGVFVPPPGFETMRGMRSVIVFGEEGAGKTTLRLALLAAVGGNVQEQVGAETPAPLIVEWQPGVLKDIDGEVAVAQFMDEILDLTAQNLATKLSGQPARFRQASHWTQEAITWLVHRYLQTSPELFLLRLEEDAPAAGLECVQEIINRPPKALVSTNAPYPRQLTAVIQTLKAVGFSGLWVMIDGLESWSSITPSVLGKTLTALFSALALFDIPGFAVKVMAPDRLRNLVSTSTGLARRRFEIFDLEWPKELLLKICDIRLALACDQANFRLAWLSADPGFADLLEKYGGGAPRGWLEFLRPYLDSYLQQPQRRPLTPAVTAEISRRFPPRLRMDAAGEVVTLGYWAAPELTASSLAILRYLYRHANRACPKEELYYRGYRGLAYEPRSPAEAGWEAQKTVEGIMDTALWRLRQALEPDPKRPIYIVSQRGKGIVRLLNVG